MLGPVIDWVRGLWTDPDTQVITFLNAIFAWAAAVVHGWAAHKTSGWLRRLFIVISGLALFYSLAYWWLFFNPGEGRIWSRMLRPFGLVTWGVAWVAEPVVLIRYFDRASHLIVGRAEVVAADKAAEMERITSE